MKRITLFIGIFACMAFAGSANAQTRTYSTSGGELIFSWGDLKYSQDFLNTYNQAEIVNNPVRFTLFFHVQQFWHVDFSNNIGFFTGMGLRNIGMISDERLPINYVDGSGTQYSPANPYPADGEYFDAKIIRRTYSVGIPLALKLGSFKDHLHIYGGGEMEWSFHMKEKWWNSHSRSGSKTKSTSWWPEQITTFLPSAFVGVQFPGGINLKFKYYLENFLNHDYGKTRNQNNPAQSPGQVVSDLSKYEQSNLFYVSLSFHFKTAKLMQNIDSGTVATLY
jgi:hypothetical protein